VRLCSPSFDGRSDVGGSCPPSKARTVDRPDEFQIRGWPDWLHSDAEVEQLEGAVLDEGELRIEDEARLRGAVHGHDIAGHGHLAPGGEGGTQARVNWNEPAALLLGSTITQLDHEADFAGRTTTMSRASSDVHWSGMIVQIQHVAFRARR
jgi:hypothetical protein